LLIFDRFQFSGCVEELRLATNSEREELEDGNAEMKKKIQQLERMMR